MNSVKIVITQNGLRRYKLQSPILRTLFFLTLTFQFTDFEATNPTPTLITIATSER
ncbi:hypothetical protein SLEP1_g26980 [Rubroshorea leprosula]|uniref:Uncharacterized protein n=1 Tax=Rubroshorea leprosula TaxID=152421 RepID=A0AAV5JXK0_9ROSI|nr:hypothetical protein SLEP1_g26980 [Rubroshorea leprosula]